MAAHAKEELLQLLDRKAFDPVLRAKPADFPQSKRDRLADVQERTRREQDRYHHYGSAGEIVRMFHDDLDSEPAKKVHRSLDELGLPTLNDLQDEFDRLADKLGAR
jgi:hypothetical protein